MKLLHTEILVKQIKQEGIDYDAFRDLRINEKVIRKIDKKVKHIVKQHPRLKGYAYIDNIAYLTFSMLAKDYNPVAHGVSDVDTFLRGIGDVAGTESFQELYRYYKAIFSDLMFFPVPSKNSKEEDIEYWDTWYDLRKYGGNRRHEGTDLMAIENVRGILPVVSMTDGIVENMGWLEQGGYRIGIRSEAGGYFYYAHLDTYAPELKKGDKVIAGQLLGFMGDSGYGSEGTIGKFDVHLHLGIYVDSIMGEMSINPYYILKMLEDNRSGYLYE
ncbi:M23 family metallopeptidase [Mobilitalea sibirica]|uniref:M23 family metallopeptidase n=2 Tax=Mobilitalea sibirica TaxID=1462919 RepID=A0A8J7HAA9_9FIRM|nr:M23 family metallopeptidase [Mobilitalea sibirica]